jgi:Mg2+-importing ATPase
VLFVLLVNIVFRRPLLESFLFSGALAVGMTPEMMPMITTITLAQGARRMAKKKVLVKQLAAIEDFGSVEILCSDKTGTLTEGEIVLDRHVDVQGNEDENVLRHVYLNSHFQAGIRIFGRRGLEVDTQPLWNMRRWTRSPSTPIGSAFQ